MRILIYSRAFLPLIGGLELNVAALAANFSRRGHEVVVLTTTPGDEDPGLDYRVVREPGPLQFLRWMRWCDVFHQPNVSLRGIWPLFVVPRPWVVSHHSWYRRPDGRIAWQDRIKRALVRRAAGSIAVSHSVADDLDGAATVINNAYRDDVFRTMAGIDRTEDLVFVGRLVSDKGVDVLLDALAALDRRGVRPGLSVVGTGPELAALERQARELGLGERVRFVGQRTGAELAALLNRHRILVAPSRYNEPFGIVALEGIACGCVVVGSRGGGLADAIGPCGRTFPNGDAAALADVLADLLRDPAAMRECLRHAAGHLARHSTETVTRLYMDVFEAAMRRGG
jgi:glycogen(starch) synthase